MKIVDIKTYSLVYPVKDPFSNAMRTTRERAFGLIEDSVSAPARKHA